MSQENVEIVRRDYDAYLSGDFEAALAMIDPEVVGMHRGPFRTAMSPADTTEWSRRCEPGRGAWEAFRIDVDEIIDAGDQVLVVEQQSGRGKGSGVPLAQQNFSVFTIRDEKIIQVVVLRARDEALEAAGLSE